MVEEADYSTRFSADSGNQYGVTTEFAGEGGIVVDIRGVIGFDTTLHCPKTITTLRKAEAEVATNRAVPTENIYAFWIVATNSRGQLILGTKYRNPRFNTKGAELPAPVYGPLPPPQKE